MRILMITNTLPYPPVSGTSVRSYNLLRRIAAHHEVWLASRRHTRDARKDIAHLENFCARVATGFVPHRNPINHLPGLARYALRQWPLELKFYHSSELVQHLHDFTAETVFDIVQIEEGCMALYLEHLRAQSHHKRILTFYDIDFVRAGRMASLHVTPLQAWRMQLHQRMMRRWEPRYAGRFDRCLTVSEIDRNWLLGANPRLAVTVIPNGTDTRLNQPLPTGEEIPAAIFVGSMHYAPCVDAATYLCTEILPEIRRHIPSVEIWLVGANPGPQIQRLAGAGVHVTGRVEDVRPYYARSAVSVVPIRAGGGTRLKILEAMALGRPIVTTSVGCEGLDVTHREHLLIANTTEDFAASVVQLMRDGALYRRIATQARQRVVDRYDWDHIASEQMRVYDELML
ncbi:MAG: glycosyltransferase [Chloroflexi bacterium]|nr:glycosyltransferase [Chloroflexota bacterium]